MKTRALFLVGLYLVLTLTLTGIIGIPQNSLADGFPGDPPINDTISADTTMQSSTNSTNPDISTGIDYWLIIKTIITIGI